MRPPRVHRPLDAHWTRAQHQRAAQAASGDEDLAEADAEAATHLAARYCQAVAELEASGVVRTGVRRGTQTAYRTVFPPSITLL
jgi:hypothetical protein